MGLTVLLHVLLMSPLLFGAGHHARPPATQEGGETSGVPAMTLVSLQDEVDESAQADHASLANLLVTEPTLSPIGSLNLSSSAAPITAQLNDPDAAQSPEESSNDNPGERALMFGRYLGQVSARIDRAWLRPRSAIGSSTFSCLVQVDQDRNRNVKEVTLKQCNGTTAWQLSLVHAIESASPFPAPPDPSVFSPTLTIQMTADAFAPGGSTDGYEPVVGDLAAGQPRVEQR